MKLKEIQDSWEADCKYDRTSLDEESLKTPKLHNKYMKIYSAEKLKYKTFEHTLKKIVFRKGRYYGGKLTQTELQEYGYQPWEERILKSDIDNYVGADDEVLEWKAKLALQLEKVEYLESILKAISNRNWEIRNAIEFMKFMNGGV